MEWIVLVTVVYILYKTARSAENKNKRSSLSRRVSEEESSFISVSVTTSSGSSKRTRSHDLPSGFRLSGILVHDVNEPIAGRWICLGEEITVDGLHIKDGGFYLCDDKKYSGNREDASLVDITQTIHPSTYKYEDPQIGYYPSFHKLNPRAKGAYIDWLSSNKEDSLTSITYVFLYFYGIERRFLVDHINDKNSLKQDELRALFKELTRLKSVYSKNNSFKVYATKLLDLMILLEPNLFPNIRQPYISASNSLSLRYQIGQCALKKIPIGPAIAYGWIRYHPSYSVSRVVRRCENHFKQLFKLRYMEHYGQGIFVKENKRKLDVGYRPASPSLLYCDLNLPNVDVPDPFELTGPLRKLSAIADSVTDELRPLSRYLGKEGNRPEDIEASLLLPKPLLAQKLPPKLSKVSKILKAHIDTRDKMLPVAGIWKLLDIPAPEKMNKAEINLLCRILDNLDIGFAPDPRIHHVKPDPKGGISLFRQSAVEKAALTSSIKEYSTVVRLGSMIAVQNGTEGEETRALKQVIDSNIHLSASDKVSLQAYLRWSMGAPINMAGMKKRVDVMDQEQRKVLSKLLVSIAMADGHASSDEIRQLERIYKALGLQKTIVARDIHEMSSFSVKRRVKSEGTNTLASIESGLKGIQESPTAVPPESAKTSAIFALDEAVLALHESETNHAQSLLSNIFSDEDELGGPEDSEEILEVTEEHDSREVPSNEVDGGELEGANLLSGLDEFHQAMLLHLITSTRWSRENVDVIARAQGLMLSGALEVLNDWTFDQVDAPLIEDVGDVIEIDQDVLEELNTVWEMNR